jgi:hypothetical protein
MIIKQVSYKRIFNLGNYESATVEIVADINATEKPEEVLDQLIAKTKVWRDKKEKGAL